MLKRLQILALVVTSGFFIALEVGAHDLRGIMSERNIPKNVLEKLDKRAEFRNPMLRKQVLKLAALSRGEQEKRLKELNLPTKFESALESIFQATAKWDRGATLTVCFFDGDQSARERVLDVASKIFTLAQLHMDIGEPSNIRTCDVLRPSAIRVAFNTDGYYSYIGTDAQAIPAALPTLGLENYHWFPTLSKSQKGTIRHEFMHAIGALHEHQHPSAKCNEEFNWSVIFTTIPWPPEKIKFNMKPITELAQFATAVIVSGEYDPSSIMHYDLPEHLFKDSANASCFVDANNQLSHEDRKMIKKMYVDD